MFLSPLSNAHTVSYGDTVWGISKKYNISMEQLIKWNGIKNNTIHPGDLLTVSPLITKVNNINYTVQSGDSVWGISKRFGITMNQLLEWNGIKNNTIYPKQVLVVSHPNVPMSKQTYSVQSGDTLWKIAAIYGLSIAELTNINNIKNNIIYPGQILVVRDLQVGTDYKNIHTVAKQETLWSIANQYNVPLNNLLSINHLNSNTILVGQKLLIPINSILTNTNTNYYTVKQGDSIWRIAHNNGITMSELIKWNHIENNTIHPGQKIVVRETTPIIDSIPNHPNLPIVESIPNNINGPIIDTIPNDPSTPIIDGIPNNPSVPNIEVIPIPKNEANINFYDGIYEKTIKETIYGHQKDVKIYRGTSISATDDPNTIAKVITKEGLLKQIRFFDSQGKAMLDIDYENHGNSTTHPEVPHQHRWKNGIRLKQWEKVGVLWETYEFLQDAKKFIEN